MKRAGAPLSPRRAPRAGHRRAALAVLLAAALLAPARGFGQERTPEEYREEEFPRALRDLRRGEIILVGSLPVSLFVSLLAVDLYRFGANDWDRQYAPWPVRSPSSPPYTRGETWIILGSALSLSALLAVADYVVGRIGERRAQSAAPRGR